MTRTAPVSAYRTLGVTAQDSFDTIKTAYKRLVRAHHPDVTGGDCTRLAEINEAYDALRHHCEQRPEQSGAQGGASRAAAEDAEKERRRKAEAARRAAAQDAARQAARRAAQEAAERRAAARAARCKAEEQEARRLAEARRQAREAASRRSSLADTLRAAYGHLQKAAPAAELLNRTA